MLVIKKGLVGLIGFGVINPAYLSNRTIVFSPVVEEAACSDLLPVLAQKRAEDFQIPNPNRNSETRGNALK